MKKITIAFILALSLLFSLTTGCLTVQAAEPTTIVPVQTHGYTGLADPTTLDVVANPSPVVTLQGINDPQMSWVMEFDSVTKINGMTLMDAVGIDAPQAADRTGDGQIWYSADGKTWTQVAFEVSGEVVPAAYDTLTSGLVNPDPGNPGYADWAKYTYTFAKTVSAKYVALYFPRGIEYNKEHIGMMGYISGMISFETFQGVYDSELYPDDDDTVDPSNPETGDALLPIAVVAVAAIAANFVVTKKKR